LVKHFSSEESKMTIMELGAIGEFVGAIAVVVTLIYLAIQLRQNSKTVQVSMIQAMERGVSDVLGQWSRDPETIALMRRARVSFDGLSENEKALVSTLIRRLVLHMDSMHWAFKQGVLPKEIWEREASVLRGWLNSEAGKATWRVGGWTESFRQYVESDVLQPS
jgi:hypothetical protein